MVPNIDVFYPNIIHGPLTQIQTTLVATKHTLSLTQPQFMKKSCHQKHSRFRFCNIFNHHRTSNMLLQLRLPKKSSPNKPECVSPCRSPKIKITCHACICEPFKNWL